MKTIPLPNNLCVVFNDLTRQYFGDFHHVKIEVSCEIPLKDTMFASPEEYAEAVRLLGTQATYRKVLEKMGVPTAEITTTQSALVDLFENHTIAYISSPLFPIRFIKSELAKKTKAPSRRSTP